MALLLEFVLYPRGIGLAVRGLGSRPEAAREAGISPVKTRLIAYVGCSFLAGLAAITMMSQVGVGDRRGKAVWRAQINSVTSFLGLDQAWQNYLLGGLILIAVALYSKSRALVVAA